MGFIQYVSNYSVPSYIKNEGRPASILSADFQHAVSLLLIYVKHKPDHIVLRWSSIPKF